MGGWVMVSPGIWGLDTTFMPYPAPTLCVADLEHLQDSCACRGPASRERWLCRRHACGQEEGLRGLTQERGAV